MSIYADKRGIAHGGTQGLSAVFPDVCKTPVPGASPVPLPYPNVAKSSDVVDGPTSVTLQGNMPATKGARYSKSSGDEAGSVGGVMSGTTGDEARFISYSFTVFFEGENVCRLGDTLMHNKKNAAG